MPRFAIDTRTINAQHAKAAFYREEFAKHHRWLQRHRPYYSEAAITDAETALARILAELDQICSKDNADQLVGSLLKKFDVVTGISSWSQVKRTN